MTNKNRMMLFGLLVMVLSLGVVLSAQAVRDGYTADPAEDFEYIFVGDHAEIHRYIGCNQTVVVPDTIDGKPVTVVRLGKNDYENVPGFYPYVRKIVLPETVVKLDDNCFGWYTLLKEVVGLEDVQVLGENVFDRTSSLKTIHFSEKLREMDLYALSGNFMGVQSLWLPDSLELPESVSFPSTSVPDLVDFQLVSGSGGAKLYLADNMLFSADRKMLYWVLPFNRSAICIIPEGTEKVCASVFTDHLFVTEFLIPASVTTITNAESFNTEYVYHVQKDSEFLSILKNYEQEHGVTLKIEISEEDTGSVSKKVSEILAETIRDGMSDYEKARALHDWICENATYDYTLKGTNASDILLKGTGVCDAYTRAYCILLEAAGISSVRIECSLTGIGHAINGIRIGDKWYLVDVTNDDEGFGLGEDLFCFNEYIFRANYDGNLSVSAEDISLYPAFREGKLDTDIAALAGEIDSKIGSGETAFTLEASGLSSLWAQAAVSTLDGTERTVSDQAWLISCECIDGGNTFNVICAPKHAEQDFLYNITEAGVELTAYLGSDTAVTVPDTLEGKPVISIGKVFSENKTLQEVHLPEGLEEIPEKAFYGCTSLKSITWPASLKEIGSLAFTSCHSLGPKVVLPDGVVTIGDNAFRDCGALQSVFLPGSFSNVGKNIFAGCTILDEVTLADGIPVIGESMFANCSRLKTVQLPESITEIRSGAFVGSGLISLELPKNVSSIAWSAFVETTALTGLTVSDDNPYYTVKDGMLFSKDKKTLYRVVGKTSEVCNIPEGTVTISKFAFAFDETILTVYLPSSIRKIEGYAFTHCVIADIEIEEGLEEIGDYAFSSRGELWTGDLLGKWALGSIRTLKIPDTVRTIGTGAFRENWLLKELIIPAGVASLPENIVTYPLRMVIPSSVTSIGSQEIGSNGEEMVICGMAGSEAENFARTNGYTFIPVGQQLYVSASCTNLLPGEETVLSAAFLDGQEEHDISGITWTVEPAIAEIRDGILKAKTAGYAVVHAQYGEASGSFSIHVYDMTEESELWIETPGGFVFWLGEHHQMSLKARVNDILEDGSRAQVDLDLNEHCVWSVTNEAAAAINRFGMLTTVGGGTGKVIATLPNGQSCSADFVIYTQGSRVENESGDPVEEQLQVSAACTKLLPGEETELLVTFMDGQQGPDLSDIAWTVEPAIAEVRDGKLKAKTAGYATVHAQCGEASGTVSIHVYDMTEESELRIETSGSSDFGGKESHQMSLQAKVNDILEDGTRAQVYLDLSGRCVWSVTDESVATISETGMLTTVGSGTGKVIATLPNGQSCSFDFVVTIQESKGESGESAEELLEKAVLRLEMPADGTVIEEEAFTKTAAQAVIVPEGYRSIGAGAFAFCPNLIVVILPSTIEQIDNGAFDGSDSVTLIVCNDYAEAYAKEKGIPCCTTR